ncbi:uncharacterized protein LOC112453957 [Temnothorax curvispinosus]|uniref:Uncharacterized protein LOC112453957 n=1 Tax=Temnothorax curvispinosus TaxID=300111 RepID=A0A6J1PMA3_9HYME|nr:uncharacterized protein LOC112453957 [Temnothorax curvispinosus]XP_024870787.1 uncharacterized protein LOC112453957 [Temnothorax curvispinosus]XP_024870788.1 uncharacterized protein LOC112453957 [Temnothorax curvispinosus]
MESKARNRINNDYTKFFYATMCHVCKRFGDGVLLKRCGDCRMISYCGKEHQKQHWEQHKPLCEAIRDMPRDYRMDYRGETAEEWAKKKMFFAQLVSSRLGRRLHVDEKEIIYFPKECLVCHERESLESCQKCAASFCQIHKNNPDHWGICAPLQLRFYIDLNEIGKGNGLPDIPVVREDTSCTSTFQNMRDFIEARWNIQTDSQMLYDVRVGELSRDLTCPLTLFYAVKLLNYDLKGTFLVIHIVGATCIDKALVRKWKFFQMLMKRLISIKIVMIGPGLKHKFDPLRTDDFLGENKYLFFEYHDVSYEKYVRSSSFKKPNLIFGFSVTIDEKDKDYEDLVFNKDISAPSIQALAKQNCPFVLTFTVLQCFQEQINKINTILGKEVDYLYKGKNPFAECTPQRGFGYVNYVNQYLVIYRSLCS